MRKIIMDEKAKEYYRLPKVRKQRWTMLMGIVALVISLIICSYGLYNLIITTIATATANELLVWEMFILGGFTNILIALAPFMILGILIYEIRSLVDLVRRIRESDKE